MIARYASAVLMLSLACCVSVARAQAVRLVEEVGATSQPGYVAVTVLFGCTVRYVGHSPASNGDVVRVRLAPQRDCLSPVSGGTPRTIDDAGVIRSVNVETTVGTYVELVLQWTRTEDFVLVPASDGHALLVRLLREAADGSLVLVQDIPGGMSTYAINLESSRTPFEAAAIAQAGQVAQSPIYVSETQVDGETWYRLRAGPFMTEQDARRVLLNARGAYPRAWVAMGDDSTLTEVGAPNVVTEVPAAKPAAATLTPAERETLQGQAREAFQRKDYATAIPLLTRLTEQPEYAGRAEAQEVLGLAHERSGQMAHAKAEYEDFLRRYPGSEAAGRVRKRLQALLFAASPAAVRTRMSAEEESAWRIVGGVSQLYRRDTATFDDGTESNDFTTQDALLTDVAFVARRRGERFDFSTRASAGYALDMLQNGPGDQTRVTTLSAEITDRELEWTLRGGRQTGSTGALIGTFDGLYGGYQLLPRLRLNAWLGYPVESTRAEPSTDASFYALSADFGTFAEAWDASVYAVSQTYFDLTDRQAIGGELRYFRPGRTMVAVVDYDFHFQELNDLLLIGSLELPARWTLAVNLDHRKSPALGLRNAMIGQSVESFDELFGVYTESELEQLALDRTAETSTYTVSLSRPIGEHWQWSTDLSAISMGETLASGGVEALPDQGTDVVVATQAIGYGLFGRGDVNSIGLRYQTGDTGDTISLGLSSQFPIGDAWRIGPRLRYDDRTYDFDSSSQTIITPGLRVELRWHSFLFELEGGAEIGKRSLATSDQDTTRYFVSLGYRYDF